MTVVSNWEIHVHSYPIEQGQRGFKHKFSPFENVFAIAGEISLLW